MECVPCTYAEHIIRPQIFSDEPAVGMIYHGHQLQHLETEHYYVHIQMGENVQQFPDFLFINFKYY